MQRACRIGILAIAVCVASRLDWTLDKEQDCFASISRETKFLFDRPAGSVVTIVQASTYELIAFLWYSLTFTVVI
jgi:hypothetical protein